MTSNFKKAFRPTLEDKQATYVALLEMEINSIKDKSCPSCIHSKSIKDYEMGKETSILICCLDGHCCCKNCKKYDLRDFRDLF